MATSSSSRKPLKRVFDLCDSPASSTPPRPPNKRQHVDPSDSPTNPFGLFTVTNPRSLPRMSHTDEHLVLRFQLASRNNVFRIAYAPMNYSFWHLSQLVQFLFGWKDVRYVRTRSSKRVRREVQHLALVQKDVTFFNNSTRVGLVKAGRTVAKVVAQLPDKKSSKRYEDSRLELEDGFTLQHVWPKGTEYNRAVVYVSHSFYRRQPPRDTASHTFLCFFFHLRNTVSTLTTRKLYISHFTGKYKRRPVTGMGTAIHRWSFRVPVYPMMTKTTMTLLSTFSNGTK